MIVGIAAWTKIKDPSEVIATMNRSGLLPSSWDRVSAYAVIGVEILLTISLLSRFTAKFGLRAYAAFSALLFGYSVWRWWQDIKAPCGCFGLLLRLNPWQGVAISALMCAASMVVLRDLIRASSENPAPAGATSS